MRSNRLSRKSKGITPVISVIVLLFITIALLGTASQYLFNYIQPSVYKSFDIPTNGAFCQSTESGYRISVYVKNTGLGTIDLEDIVAREVDGKEITDSEMANLPLEKGSPAKRVIYYTVPCQTGQKCSGYHTVTLGTSAGIRQIDVYCP